MIPSCSFKGGCRVSLIRLLFFRARYNLATRSSHTQTGLAIGRLSPNGVGDFIVGFARTPEDPDRDPDSEAPPGGAAVDAAWIGDHATQVARMLPGGLAVIGLFVFASDADVTSLLGALAPALRGLKASLAAPAESDRLLLRIGPSKEGETFSVRRCSRLGAVTWRPWEAQLASVGQSLACLTATAAVDASGTLEPERGAAATERGSAPLALRRASYAAAEAVSRGLKAAALLHDGELFVSGGRKLQPGPLQLELLQRPAFWREEEGGSGSAGGGLAAASGRWALRGTLQALAYCPAKDGAEAAEAALRDNLQTSLRSRIDVWADIARDSDAASPRAPTMRLPRCVLFPWLADAGGVPLHLCDYLSPEETAEDAIERIEELLGIHVQAVALLPLEAAVDLTVAPLATRRPQAPPPALAKQAYGEQALTQPTFMGFIIVAFLAILAAWLYSMRGKLAA